MKWFLLMMLAVAMMGIFACDDAGSSSADTVVSDDGESIATADADVLSVDGGSAPQVNCPGLFNSDDGTCEPIPFGSLDCTDSTADCAPLTVSIPCFDIKDFDRYHDDAGNDAIFVNSTEAIGDGLGTFLEPFATISNAIAAAEPGSTIAVAPGTYEENLYIDQLPGLRLLALGDCDGETVVISGSDSAPTLTVAFSPGTEVIGFRFDGGERGLSLEGAATDILVEHNEIVQASADGIRVAADLSDGLLIHSNIVRHTKGGGCGIRLDAPSGARVEGNHIHDILGVGICVNLGNDVELSHNAITDNVGAGVSIIEAGTTLSNNSIHSNQEGGVVLTGEADQPIRILANDILLNDVAGVLVDSTGAVEIAHNRIAQSAVAALGAEASTGGYGIAVSHPNASLQIRHSHIQDHARCGIVLFGVADGIPADAVPGPQDSTALIEGNIVESAGGAGILLDGGGQVRLLDNAVKDVQIGPDGTDGDGIAVRRTAVYIEGGVVENSARNGVSFSESKARVTAVELVDNASGDIVCTENFCPNVVVTDGSPSGDATPLSGTYEPVAITSLLP